MTRIVCSELPEHFKRTWLSESCFVCKKELHSSMNNTDLEVWRVGFCSKLDREFVVAERVFLLGFVHLELWFPTEISFAAQGTFWLSQLVWMRVGGFCASHMEDGGIALSPTAHGTALHSSYTVQNVSSSRVGRLWCRNYKRFSFSSKGILYPMEIFQIASVFCWSIFPSVCVLEKWWGDH